MTAPTPAVHSGLHREWVANRPVPTLLTLSGLRRGSGDPTWAHESGAVWRAAHTPEGPATLRVMTNGGTTVRADAWGPGAAWQLDQVPDLFGARDDESGFELHHEVLRGPRRRLRHWRVGRTARVIDALVPTILEQKVTGKQAFGAYRRLVRRFGGPAPGPRGVPVMLPPDVRAWRAIPSWEWVQAGVDAARADTVMRALRVADRLDECIDLALPQAHSRLRSIPGIGVWTAAEVAQQALGDADAVSFGDYHLAKNIGFALTGRPVDDIGLEELLRPYAGHRYRVQFLVEASGLGPARRGARLDVPSHLPIRGR